MSKQHEVKVVTKGKFYQLYWDGRMVYKSQDEQKVRNREKVLQNYAAKLNEQKNGEK